MKSSIAPCLLGWALGLGLAHGSPTTFQGGWVDRKGEHLDLEAKDAPVEQVVEALAKTLGAEVRGTPSTSIPITATFEHRSIPDALTRLFGDSFTLVFDRSGHLKSIRFLGGPGKATALPPQTNPSSPTTPTALDDSDPAVREFKARVHKKLAEIGKHWQKHRPVGVEGQLSKALGGKSVASLNDLVQLAAMGDAAIREKAMQLLATEIDGDASLRRALVTELKDLPDGVVVSLARGFLGKQVADFLGRFAQVTHDERLRAKASNTRYSIMRAVTPP